MDEYIPYIVVTILVVLIGGLVASKFHTKITDLNKCIGCQYSEICDKGDPNNVCHLDEKK